MALWRREFRKNFPEVYQQFHPGRRNQSFYAALGELSRHHSTWVKTGNWQRVELAYQMLEYFLRKKGKNYHMWNAAFVCFLEHLFDEIPDDKLLEVAKRMKPHMKATWLGGGFYPEYLQGKRPQR